MEEMNNNISNQDINTNSNTNSNTNTNTNDESAKSIDLERELERKNMELELEFNRKLEEAKEEQAKLAKMNDLERREYEYNKMKEEFDRLKKEQLVQNLTNEAKKILEQRQVPSDFASFCIGADAKETKEKIDNLTNIFNKAVNEAVNARLLGNNRIPTNGNTNYGNVKDLDYYRNHLDELGRLPLEEQRKILLRR